MKNSLKSLSTTLFIIVALIGSINGQDKTALNMHRDIVFSGGSEEIEIKIQVTEENNNLNISVRSMIKGGELTIEIIDPNGDKQGTFSVGCQIDSKTSEKSQFIPFKTKDKNPRVYKTISEKSTDSTNDNTKTKEIVNASISKTIKNPIKGNWIIKAIPKEAHGELTIDSGQHYSDDSQRNNE